MIEYDKANVTSSYPSLTEYEVANFLDKAYNALIAQKVTGNNLRRSTFESDIKSIADLAPIIINKPIGPNINDTRIAENVITIDTPTDMLYFLQATMDYTVKKDKDTPADGKRTRSLPIKLVNHDIASKFFASAYNVPWIKEPVCYLENNKIYIVYDPINTPDITSAINVVYIKKPNTFVKDMNRIQAWAEECSYFDYKNPRQFSTPGHPPYTHAEELKDLYTFECNDTVAEELISLAITFALENIESSRLTAKLNMRGLEA